MKITVEDIARIEEINKEVAIRVEGMSEAYQRKLNDHSRGSYHDWYVSEKDKNIIDVVYESYSCGDTDHDYYHFKIEDIVADDAITRAEAQAVADQKAWQEELIRREEKKKKEKEDEEKAHERGLRRLYEELKAKYEKEGKK
jgi:vacuolar-type H+-ATPase subunit I/STV1